MSGTTIKLLTRDGAIAATFSALLTPEQYEEIYVAVRDVDSPADLWRVLTEAATKWGLQVEVEQVY